MSATPTTPCATARTVAVERWGAPAYAPADLAVPPDRDELIAYGPLLSDDGAAWLGTAVLLRAPNPGTARAILTPDRYAGVEVHNWQFGGRS